MEGLILLEERDVFQKQNLVWCRVGQACVLRQGRANIHFQLLPAGIRKQNLEGGLAARLS